MMLPEGADDIRDPSFGDVMRRLAIVQADNQARLRKARRTLAVAWVAAVAAISALLFQSANLVATLAGRCTP